MESAQITSAIARIVVPAFLRNDKERCQTNKPIVRALGTWYNGISMMNAERCPLKMTRFNNEPLSTRVTIESRINPQETKSAFDPKKTGARKATTAIRAVQGTKGAIKIVKKRAGFESITRVPKMDGTLQPKPKKNGR